MKNKVLLSLLVLVGIFTITGCGSNNSTKLVCKSEYEQSDQLRTWVYTFTYDKLGSKMQEVEERDSIEYYDGKLGEYNIKQNQEYCAEVNDYAGVYCKYTISDDHTVSTVEVGLEISKLDSNGREIFEDEGYADFENYSLNELKEELESEEDFSCEVH